MEIKNTIKVTTSTVVFIVVIVGVFWITQKTLTNNVMHCALVAVMAAVVLTYVQNRYLSEILTQSEYIKNAKLEAKGLRARHKRLEEKVQKLTTELKAANLKLKAEIADQPLDQRKLQQRLKHLNCL